MLIAVITITQLTSFVNNSIVNKLLKVGFYKPIYIEPTLLDEAGIIFYNKIIFQDYILKFGERNKNE